MAIPRQMRRSISLPVKLIPGSIYQVRYAFFASFAPFNGDWDREQEVYLREGNKVMFLEPTEELGYDPNTRHGPDMTAEPSACKFLILEDNRVIYANINYKESIEYFEPVLIASAPSP